MNTHFLGIRCFLWSQIAMFAAVAEETPAERAPGLGTLAGRLIFYSRTLMPIGVNESRAELDNRAAESCISDVKRHVARLRPETRTALHATCALAPKAQGELDFMARVWKNELDSVMEGRANGG